MARRVQVWLLGALALSHTGCYLHHTADEEELEFAVPGADASVPSPGDPGALPTVSDAGVAAVDAAVDCQTLPDIVQQVLCTARQSAPPGTTPGNTGVSIEDLLGGLLGGGRGRDAGMVGTGVGGQITIEDILGGLLDGGRNGNRDAGAGGLGDLLGGASCRNPTDPFARLLCGLTGAGGAGRDGGAPLGADPIGSLLDGLTELQCRSATQGLTQLFCFFRELSTRAARRDGGVPRVDAGAQPGANDASVDAATPDTTDAATLEDAALDPLLL